MSVTYFKVGGTPIIDRAAETGFTSDIEVFCLSYAWFLQVQITGQSSGSPTITLEHRATGLTEFEPYKDLITLAAVPEGFFDSILPGGDWRVVYVPNGVNVGALISIPIEFKRP